VLPVYGVFEFVIYLLQLERNSAGILARVRSEAQRHRSEGEFMARLKQVPQALEALILDGWVKASYDPAFPLLPSKHTSEMIRWDHEIVAPPMPAPH